MREIAPPVLACVAAALAQEGPVSRQDTHISTVLLAGGRVFKLKRPVHFPYLDFTTPERRLAACEAELALNRRTAPNLYRAVHRITQAADGTPVLDGDGPLLDAAVEMRRFPEADLFDAMVRAGRLEPSHLEDLAGRLAAFHAAAEPNTEGGGAEAMAHLLSMNATALREARLLPQEEMDNLVGRFEAARVRVAAILEARRAAGKVRRCHGDLTLRNICLFEGVPTLFDCVEFDAGLATIDVLYDVAFPLMDLCHRGRDDLANLLFNRYLDAADETDGLALLPLFMAVRAAIRAHVTASGAGDRAEARAYCDLAARLLVPSPACLVAVGGFSGSGKSSLAQALAPALGPAPGARVLSSDRIRKRLWGVDPTTRLPEAAYAPSVSLRVYERMEAEAERVLSVGHAVIADAVFERAEARDGIRALAERRGVPFHGFWLTAPGAALAARIAARRDDPSDATAAVVEAQIRRGAESPTWDQLDATRDRQALRIAALARMTGGDGRQATCPRATPDGDQVDA